jgi:TrmH family RNA methyltransferase
VYHTGVPVITSRQHAVVKAFRAAARGDDLRALIDGWHLLHEAEAAGITLDTVALSDEPRNETDRRLIARVALHSDVTVTNVSAAVMNAISPVRTPTGIVALIHKPRREFGDVLSASPALIVVGIDVQDPGNAGAIVRAAEAAGATGVVFSGASADVWGWKALRASMGSTFRLPVHHERDAATVFELLRTNGVALLGTVPHNGRPMHEEDFRAPTAFVLGGEGAGLSHEILARMDRRVTIPMQRPVESLNVAVAAGVLVYEARRQRTSHR